MPRSKLCSLSQAVADFVHDGDSIVLCTCLETLIPFAAGHEIMRQKRKHLTLIGPISDTLFDQMIGGGCAGRVQAAWVGNVITGLGYNYKRSVEQGRVQVEHHSNFTISLALKAASMGVPFLPARTALGSDLMVSHPGLKTMNCPFTGEPLAAVAAIQPDVAIIHVQRADEAGNAHVWGCLGITREACLSSRRIILTAEEIVDSEVIRKDPNRVIVPGFRVTAVCHVPWGGYPSPVPGCYNRDHQAFLDYQQNSRTPDDFRKWMIRHVSSVSDRDELMRDVVGMKRRHGLRITRPSDAEPVNYGY